MSISKINTFCDFIDNNIIKDENTTFMIKDIDVGYLISSSIPQIPMNTFIKEIFKTFVCDADHIDSVILYTVNLLNSIKMKGLYVNYLTSHRLLLISLLLSCKMSIDEHYDNKVWTDMIGLKIGDINNMEITILKLLEFNLRIIITPEQSLAIYKSIY
jgi:hypothetical protein